MVVFGLFWIAGINLNSVYAQNQQAEEANKTIPHSARWSVSMNTLDWLLTIPNIAVEYDLSGSVYNHYTLSLRGKWNWNTYHNFKPATVFDIWSIRPEFRYYWRTKLRSGTGKQDEKQKFADWYKEYLWGAQRAHPKPWRAYYIGGYADVTDYSFKVGRRGVQGFAFGLGFSMGYSLPLYTYKKSVIDVEFGGSVGWLFTHYDVYEHDAELNYYPRVDEKCRDWHLIPFPMITDLHLSFVYRVNSIQNKYKQYDPEKRTLRERRKTERMERQAAAREARAGELLKKQKREKKKQEESVEPIDE